MTLAYARLSYRIGLLAGAIRYAARGAAGEAQADSLMEVVRYRSTHGMLDPRAGPSSEDDRARDSGREY
jgi:hypothetical protein